MTGGWARQDTGPAKKKAPADRRQDVIAALMFAFPTLEVEDVEELLMPLIDGEYRGEYGHEAWLEWVA